MTVGQQYGSIPPVPKGFVRMVTLRRIDEGSARTHGTSGHCDRDVKYYYCGDAKTLPDTTGWTPCGKELAAVMAGEWGHGRRVRSLQPRPSGGVVSVVECVQENPVLKTEGVTLKDFSFAKFFSSNGAAVQSYSSAGRKTGFPLVAALKCCSCERWHDVPEEVMKEVMRPTTSDVDRRCCRHTFLTGCGRYAGEGQGRWQQLHVCGVETMAQGLQVL
jgi:hypothetical protein